MESKLLKPNAIELNVSEWIYEPGIPENCLVIESKNFKAIEKAIGDWENKELDKNVTNNWSTHEWLHFLRNLPTSISLEDMKSLDKMFDFTNSKNSEIAFAWFMISVENDYSDADESISSFLFRIGRRKFLTPLYQKMIDKNRKEEAIEIYKKAKGNYHFVSTNTIDEILGQQE